MTKTTTKIHPVRNFLEKIVINAGVGRASQQPGFEDKMLPLIVRELDAIVGQKSKVCRAKKSIAGFKSRQGQVVGLQVTLRAQKMVDFFERLNRIVLPRVRDFSGIAYESIDKGGTLNIGFREQLVFPEINSEDSTISFSLGLNLVPKERNREKAVETYRTLGVPFKK